MVEAREVEAVSTVELVFELMVVIAEATWELVLAFTTAAIEEEAEVMVPAVEAVPAEIAVPREVEAVRTVASVCELTAEVIPEVWVLVFALMVEASDVEAVRTVAFVFELTEETAPVTSAWRASVPESSVPSESRRVLYDQTSEAVMPPLVRVRVPFVQTSAASVPKVVRERELFAQTAVGMVEAREVEAVRTSDCVASEPESRDAPVRVRVPYAQTSATSVPTEVSVLVALVQTDEARVVVETTVAPTTNVLSSFTKSPFGTLPHVICAGQTPSGPADGTE